MLAPALVPSTVLITGGAGFIGSHLTNELLAHGYVVRILDNLSPQIHGPDRRRPSYLSNECELIEGDIRDPIAVKRALRGVDAVCHLVAMVGVGQSMYEIAEYTRVNNLGTAVLLECLLKQQVERLLVASSMSIYGEGLYRCAETHREARPFRYGQFCRGEFSRSQFHSHAQRTPQQLRAGDWEPCGPEGERLTPLPTPEWKTPSLASVYALSKYDQEQMCFLVCRAYGVPAVALRFFNIYGPNQSLSNPYTGVLAIFASRLLNGNRPLINEDGFQQRDFVSVYDIARACRLAVEKPEAAGGVFNIGSGKPSTILEVAERVARVLGKKHLIPEITGKYRAGDIRHCFADITAARTALGFEPKVTFEQGLQDLASWLEGQVAVDRVVESRAQLASRGLMV